jgi:hypothetical protein
MRRMRITIQCVLPLYLFLAVGMEASSEEPPPAEPLSLTKAKIENIGAEQSSIQVRHDGQSYVLAVKAPEIKTALRSFCKGDIVNLQYRQEKERYVLQEVSLAVEEVGSWPRLIALGASAASLLFLFWLMLRSRFRYLVVGADNRYSKSKFQMALWFFLLLVSYLAVTSLRTWYAGMDLIGGIGIPQNLLILSGVSALSFAAAKAITQSRVEAQALATARGELLAVSAATARAIDLKIVGAGKPKFPDDLFQDDLGRIDLGDFQAVIITLLAVVVYGLTVFNFLELIELRKAVTLPDVDGTILAAFGLGQGAYLAKKFVGDAGGGRPQPAPPAKPPVP